MAFELLLAPETESTLRAEASRRGMSLSELAKGILEESAPATRHKSLSLVEEEGLLDELAQIGASILHTASTSTYSREMIYADHN